VIDGLKPYTAVKASGAPWLEEVPAHWTARRLRTVAEMRVSHVDKVAKDGERPVRLCNYVDVYKNDRIRDRMAFMSATATESEIERFRLAVGDVLITKDSESWDDIGVPALVVESADDLISGYHLALLRPAAGHLTGGYLFRALQSRLVAYQFHIEANGVTRYGLSHAAIKAVTIPVPPLPEQVAIVRFLDYADRRVRRYMAAKKRLIALLNEQRQAIVREAVTRGVASDVRFKSSGVERLGEVPAHWQLERVKHATGILRGKFAHRPRNDPSLYDGPYPFIQTGDVARAARRITSFRQTLNERGLAVSKMFPRGTLVMTIAANIGDVAVLDFDACFPDSVVGFVPRPAVDRDFLYFVFVAMKAELLLEAPVNTQGNLNVDRIGSRVVALPPLAEQREIVRAIEVELSSFERVLSMARAEMALVREYRARLIEDAVTGKLDLREVAGNLPDEDEEPEQADSMDHLAEGSESQDEGDLDDVVDEVVA
jgi:type I restriction enzyme S subunit